MDNPALNLEGDVETESLDGKQEQEQHELKAKQEQKEKELQQTGGDGDHQINFDAVLDVIGHFGKYSIMVFVLSCFASYLCGSPVVQDTFVSYENPYRYTQ